MTITTPRLRTLLRQAKKVADNGKRDAALSLYQEILEEAPHVEEAWLGVAALSPDDGAKEAAYEKALALNENNREAQIGLAKLRGEAVPEPTVPEPDASEVSQTAVPVKEPESAAPIVPEPPDPPAETAVSPPVSAPQPTHEHAHTPAADADTDTLVCYRHPDRTTSLRCYTCNQPICISCAVHTPVGYRCPNCIREAESAFFNAKATDYVIAPLVSLPLSLIAALILVQFGGGFFIIIALFLSGVTGAFIGRITKAAVGRRRGRYLPHVVAAIIIFSAVVAALPALLALLFGSVSGIFGLLVPGIYAFVASSSAFYQMK